LPLHAHLPTQGAGATGPPEHWDCWIPDCDPGTAGGCASCVGTTPLLFRDMLPIWVLCARLTARPGYLRSDMTFRQNFHYSNGFWRNSGKSSPFTDAQVWSQGVSHPELNGYQQIITWYVRGAKSLRVFALRPVNGSRGQTWVNWGQIGPCVRIYSNSPNNY